jgi:hypothetical protein
MIVEGPYYLKLDAPDPMQPTVHPSESPFSFIMICNLPPQAIQGHVANLV